LSALDAHLVIRMQQVLTRLQRELDITFVYVTHSQSEAFAMADRVIIMGQGEIAQMGASKEIYRNPKTKFVAEFVGRNNIISGQVYKTGKDVIQVEAASGKFKLKPKKGDAFKKGDAISFSVSADFVHLHSEKPTGANARENIVPVTLISEEFIGSVVTLFLESADGTEFKTQVQERELNKIDLKSSQQLFLSWSANRAHILEG